MAVASESGIPSLECLLLSVVEDGEEESKSAFTTHLDWVSLSPGGLILLMDFEFLFAFQLIC